VDDFSGKAAVVTGGASGIGFAIAHRLASAGANIVLADIETDPLDRATEAIAALGVSAIGVRTDVSLSDDVDKLAAAAVDRFGQVHILVNNAGVGLKGRTWELDLTDWQWVMGVCFWGVVHGIRSFVPGMIAHGEEGHVVNTSSMAGLGGTPRGGPYEAAKHAVVAVSETLYFDLQEVAPQIGATVLCPGYVDTNIRNSRRNRPQRLGGTGAVPDAPVVQPSSAVRISPDEIAQLTFDAIRERRFYAMADWSIWRPLVADRFAALLDRQPPVPVRLP
jgi:NAD(P)-dependent dehydrogenase (short-subunit alcohol dehydrogenase family)